mmetsp:Transcript_30075/g.61248  ORF Transcript_30075/g.61248 Transcript_30075/m.61248 type:complete len:204 (-) Transcript_30075:316-927(-)
MIKLDVNIKTGGTGRCLLQHHSMNVERQKAEVSYQRPNITIATWDFEIDVYVSSPWRKTLVQALLQIRQGKGLAVLTSNRGHFDDGEVFEHIQTLKRFQAMWLEVVVGCEYCDDGGISADASLFRVPRCRPILKLPLPPRKPHTQQLGHLTLIGIRSSHIARHFLQRHQNQPRLRLRQRHPSPLNDAHDAVIVIVGTEIQFQS